MRSKSRKEGKTASQPASEGGEGRPVSTEPVGTRPQIKLPEPLDPTPAFSSSCSLLGTPSCGSDLPCQRRDEEEGGEEKERKAKHFAFYVLYQLDNTTPSGIDSILLGPIYSTVPMHGNDIPM
jgi:hypothetical protein